MIVNRLSEIMDSRGMGVSALARGACVARGTAHKLYHGRSEGIGLDVLDRVCSFLGVQVGDVFVYVTEGSGAQEIKEARNEELRARNLLLDTLEALLDIEATELKGALDRATDLVTEPIGAGMVDAWLYDPATDTLVAIGASGTPMARHQVEIGMDRLPILNGGRTVEVYQTGEPFLTGCAERDLQVLTGFTDGLSVRSVAVVPMEAAGVRRGVLQAMSAQSDAFTNDEIEFLQAVARWIGMLVHRAELVDRLTREAVVEARRVGADGIVAALAHDLGSHLSPLGSRIDGIRTRAKLQGRREDVDDVEAASVELGRLRGLLADLLELGRLGAQTAALRRREVELGALVKNAVDAAPAGNGEVRVRVAEEVTVRVDPGRVGRAVAEVLAEALRSSPDLIPVVIEVASLSAYDGRWAEIVVREESPGATATESASGETSQGSGGLGLFVARAVVEAHGGTLTVESAAREGTSFRLRLPMEGE